MSNAFELKLDEHSYSPIDLSVYKYLKHSTRDFDKNTAISFYGQNKTYSQLFEYIEKMAAALKKFGVKKGDVVIASLPAIPEAVYLFYAVNKLGAIYCGMDCRNTAEENEQIINHVNPKICFVSDFHLPTFKKIDSTTIVYVSPANSVGKFMEKISWFNDIFKGRTIIKLKKNNVFRYTEFMKKFSTTSFVDDEETSGEDVCAYFYTSGTTYGRKCVILSNENMNSAIFQNINIVHELDSGIKCGDRMLNIMPLFTCYGVSLGTHLSLCFGLEIRLLPLFNDVKMRDILIKEKPNVMITVPGQWDSFMNDNFENCDLSFMKIAVVGGDKLLGDTVNKITKIFNDCGSSIYLMNGYGLTETCSTAVSPDKFTPVGSMGRSACWTKVKIIDPDTFDELPAGAPGEICIHGPSVCMGYLKDDEATERLLKKHDDGLVWLHSGDIGYIDENGYAFFCERKKRMYVRYDGTKVSPYAIETILQKCPVIDQCIVVSKKDEKHSYGMCPVAIVVLKKDTDKESARKIIDKYIDENLAVYMKPEEVRITDALPKTKFKKVDYFAEENK